MRKYLFAAVAAGGLLLLGAAPAHADDRGVPGLLGGLLDPAGGILPTDGLDVDSPLGDAPLVDVDPGDNTPSVVPTLPAEGSTPAARTGLGSVGQRTARPKPAKAAPTRRPSATSKAATAVRPVALAGLLPDGRVSAPDTRESGLLDGHLPLLGGLLGGEPVRTLPAGDPGVAPGTAPADRPGAPAAEAPAAESPAAGDESPAAGDDDQRLAEEPVDDEAGDRAFSDGRPVAGPDPDFD
jgi:hypothetical protein